MALNLPTSDPVTDYYRPLSNGRIIVVANSSLPWSVTAAQRYARRKGIPEANILQVAFGTDRNLWTPASNTAMRAALITPLRALMDSVLAQAVLVAPGCPQSVLIYTANDQTTYYPAQNWPVSLDYLTQSCRELDTELTTYGITALCAYRGAPAIGTFPVVLQAYPAAGPFLFMGSGELQYKLGQPTPAPLDPAYMTTYEGVNAEVVTLPTQLAIDSVGNINARAAIGGRIGIGYTLECYTAEGAEIDGPYRVDPQTGPATGNLAAGFETAAAPGNRYRAPIHLQLSAAFVGMYSLAYLHSQLVGWGYQSSYFYRTGSPPAAMTTYAPAAGARYSLADLNAGRVRDIPYQLMLGDGSNAEMFYQPYRDAWKPTGGGGCIMGPSEGWCYAINGLARGGAGGVSNKLHVTADWYKWLYAYARELLSGMSWAEAVYYQGQINPVYALAVGDPLARPFPR